MKNNDLTKILAPYVKKSLWVALSSDRTKVVGEGKTMVEAVKKARENGTSKPSLLKTSFKPSGFIGSFSAK